MRRTRFRRRPCLVLAPCLPLLVLAGCQREVGPGRLKIGFVLHGLNDFTQVIAKGAEDAGRDLDADVEVTGPAGFVHEQAIAMFEAMAQKGKAGIAVVPQPGAVWVVPIRHAAAAGIPVVTANVTSPGSAASAWFGQDERRSGVLLARELRSILEAEGKLEGSIAVGSCAPGIEVLASRYEGFREGMEGSRYELTEPFDVTAENTRNYGAWENVVSSQKDLVAAVGLCSLDIPNLAKVKVRSGGKWLIAGYDLNVETLDAIRAGTAQVTVGQHPYLQGYLPVRALVEHLREGKPLVKGWIDAGTEVVTKANVDSVYEREVDEDAETRWYAAHRAERFADLSALAKPFPREKKP
ncbi:MAG: substrate-binding domain-containing protein [Planctomycetes bacterium]|nr:substrate-binding domain-containing protein [Planctomycetota bacterium]